MNSIFIALVVVAFIVIISDSYIFYKIHKSKISDEELEKLKLEYNSNNKFNIYNKARTKYIIILALTLVLPIVLILILYKILNFSNLTGITLILFFLLIWQYFVIFEMRIIKKLIRCPICNSKMDVKTNIIKIEYTPEHTALIKSMDIFFKCDHCNLKVYEKKR